jgi:opacity protein-like surface antigen
MEKKIELFIICLIVVCLSSSVVIALPPMGPPKAFLGQDMWEIGVDYGHQAMDLEAVGKVTEIQVSPVFVTVRKAKHNIDDLKSNIVMGRAGYGINDIWDAYVRLGAADADGDIERIFSDGAPSDEYEGFDGSFGLAWGFGTRATFWQDEDVSWGGLLQLTWIEPDDSDITLSGDPAFTGNAEIEMWEVQIAVGPTLRVDDGFRIYGGPFLHFIDGDLDISGTTTDLGTDFIMETSADIEEKSQFGGYAGAHLDVDENTSCFLEYQLTGDAWAVGLGVARRF